MKVVYLTMNTGKHPVAAYTCYSKLFAIHRSYANPRLWTLTHVPSGTRVEDKLGSRFLATRLLKRIETGMEHWGDDLSGDPRKLAPHVSNYYSSIVDHFMGRY